MFVLNLPLLLDFMIYMQVTSDIRGTNFAFVQNFKPKKKKKKKNSSWHVYLNVFKHIVTFQKNYMNFCVWCIKFNNKPFHPNRLIQKGTCSICVQVFGTMANGKKRIPCAASIANMNKGCVTMWPWHLSMKEGSLFCFVL